MQNKTKTDAESEPRITKFEIIESNIAECDTVKSDLMRVTISIMFLSNDSTI